MSFVGKTETIFVPHVILLDFGLGALLPNNWDVEERVHSSPELSRNATPKYRYIRPPDIKQNSLLLCCYEIETALVARAVGES